MKDATAHVTLPVPDGAEVGTTFAVYMNGERLMATVGADGRGHVDVEVTIDHESRNVAQKFENVKNMLPDDIKGHILGMTTHPRLECDETGRKALVQLLLTKCSSQDRELRKSCMDQGLADYMTRCDLVLMHVKVENFKPFRRAFRSPRHIPEDIRIVLTSEDIVRFDDFLNKPVKLAVAHRGIQYNLEDHLVVYNDHGKEVIKTVFGLWPPDDDTYNKVLSRHDKNPFPQLKLELADFSVDGVALDEWDDDIPWEDVVTNKTEQICTIHWPSHTLDTLRAERKNMRTGWGGFDVLNLPQNILDVVERNILRSR